MDAAAAAAGGDAPDQQRRRRHQLRDARALPAAARVRPRPPRRARPRRAARRATGEQHDHARRRRAHAHRRRPADLRRRARAAGHRRDHGRARLPRSTTPPPRSCSSRRTSSRRASPRQRSAWSCVPRRARASSAASIPNGRRAAPTRAMELLVEVAGAEPRPTARSTCIPNPIERPRITVRTARVERDARHRRSHADAVQRSAPAARHRDRRTEPATTFVAVPRRAAPTSNVRSTSSRRSARRHGLNNIGRTRARRSPARRAAHACASASAGSSPTCWWARAARGDHAAAGRAGRPRRDRRCRSTRVVRGREPAPRRGVGAAHRACSRACSRRSAQTSRAAIPTSRCSSSAPCSAPPVLGTLLPEERRSRLRGRDRCSCASARSAPTARSSPPTPSRGSKRSPTRCGWPISRLRRRRWSRSTRAAAPACSSSGTDVGSVGEVAATRRCAPRRRRRCVAFELDLGRALRGDAVAACSQRSGLALSELGRRPRVRRRRHRARGRRRCARCAKPGATCSRTVAVFDMFRSDSIGAGRVSIAFALRFRAPDRTLNDTEIATLRQRAIDAVVTAHGAELRGCVERGRAVRPPHPGSLRGGRRAGRRVQRALAHLLRRVVHAVLRVARLRTRLLVKEFDVMLVKAVIEWRARPASTSGSTSLLRRAASGPSRSISRTAPRSRAATFAGRRSRTARCAPVSTSRCAIPDPVRAALTERLIDV